MNNNNKKKMGNGRPLLLSVHREKSCRINNTSRVPI